MEYDPESTGQAILLALMVISLVPFTLPTYIQTMRGKITF